jgi:hypothetical protein
MVPSWHMYRTGSSSVLLCRQLADTRPVLAVY